MSGEVARIALEARGHEVTTLESPLGLTRAMHELDLVLMDVSTPTLDGDKAAFILRQHNPNRCPVVFLSDRPPEQLAAIAASTGATGHNEKTNDIICLADDVERFFKD